mgnify:CR=1 FL=1
MLHEVSLSHTNAFPVLCGRGGAVNKHPGNVVYRLVVDHNKEMYRQITKRQRTMVSKSIVQTIANAGGRFLQADARSGQWNEIDFKRAVQKTSQALRERTANEICDKGRKLAAIFTGSG